MDAKQYMEARGYKTRELKNNPLFTFAVNAGDSNYFLIFDVLKGVGFEVHEYMYNASKKEVWVKDNPTVGVIRAR